MITEIEKLLKAKEIELNIVQEQCKSLMAALAKAAESAPKSNYFWTAYSALKEWQDVARSEYKELKSLLEKAKDVQAKLDQNTK